MPALVDKAQMAMQEKRAVAVEARTNYDTVKAEVLKLEEYPPAGSELHTKLAAAASQISAAEGAASEAAAEYMNVCIAEGVSANIAGGEQFDRITASSKRPMGADAILASSEYNDIRQKLARSAKAGIGGVQSLGEAFSRDSFRNALVTGGSSTSGGAFVEPDRVAYVDIPARPQGILDWVTVGTTDSDLVEYVRLTGRPTSAAFTPEATSVDEGDEDGLKPEGSAAFEVKTAAVETIAELIPVTRNAFADAGQLRTILDQLLRDDLRRGTEQAIYNGGASANFEGILETTGINTVAYSASYNLADQIRRGITQIRLDFEEPDYIAMNPADAEKLAFLRGNDGGANTGAYLIASPTQGGIPTLWGKPVIEDAMITEGRVLIGTRNAATLWVREAAHVLVSDSHKDWFQRNVLALLAEARCAFGVQRPSAFADVDIAA